MIRVLLADDQALVREGLRMIVEAESDMSVVGQAETGGAALELTAREEPDLVMMDIRMPGIDGIEATRRIVASGSNAKVLVLTTFDLDEYVYRAMRAGASGFMLKDVRRHQLVAGIRTVLTGESLLAPTITRRLIEDFCRGPEPGGQAVRGELSKRELDVVRLVARGMSVDWSWESSSAPLYAALFRRAVALRRAKVGSGRGGAARQTEP